ncbi:MAG: sulfotransferase [Parvularculaceae bacterium]|nr:sulfotransferase [Parvularculaceae bacterium]
MMRNAPTFIVFGASRSGTTGLYTYLKQHPEIFMSPAKETNFFAYEGRTPDCAGPGAEYVNNSITRLEDYEALFGEAGSEKARGEASPLYLYVPGTAQRIRAKLPDVKLIAILRNPIDQAFSHFLYARRQMLEPLEDFNAALDAEQSRVEAGWQPMFHYARFPRYAEQLSAYFDAFPREQLQIHLYEDFEERPLEVLKEIFAFIGVDDQFSPDIEYRPNAGGVPRNKAFQDLIMKPTPASKLFSIIPADIRRRVRDAISGWNMTKETCPAAARRRLKAALGDEINALGPMIGRDVTHWLRD